MRDWIFVEDHCDAIYKVLIQGKAGESYNISGKNEITNLQIIDEITSFSGVSKDVIEFVEDRPGHDFRYSLDSSKITNELGWKPKIGFKEGMK